MKTPDYIITEEHVHYAGPMDERKLPQGAFVRPIQWCYLPAHIKEHKEWKAIDLEVYVFCHTHYGIMPIKRNILRQV